MPQDDVASQWKSFDQEKRTRLLSKMSPEQKKKLRGMLEAKPAEPAPEQTPSALSRLGTSAAQGFGVMPKEQGKKFFTDPIGTAKGMLESQGELGAQAGREFKRGDYIHATEHGIEYLLPGLGPVMAHSGEQLESGDIAGGVGTMVGMGAGLALDPERVVSAPGKVLSKVGQLRDSTQGLARKFTGTEGAVKEAVTKAAEKHGEASAAHDLTKTVDEQSLALKGHLDKVEGSVKAAADAKFDKVREKLGVTDENPGPTVNPDTLVATVKNAQEKTLNNIPESIKEFKAILAHEGIPESLANAVREHAGFEPEGAEPLTWSKLQSVKSRLDARLRAGITNGDVYQAVRDVRDGVVNEMGSLAEQHGAAAEWGDAKSTWAQYKQDFHEPSGPSGSGSPVAQALRAKDPKNIRDPFIRKDAATGNRGLDILRKYPEHGGTEAAAHADSLIQNAQELSKPISRSPKSPVVDAEAVARDHIAKKAEQWGNFNKRDLGIIGGSLVAGLIDFAIGGKAELPAAVIGYEGTTYAIGRAMRRPAVVEWLSKTPQAELDVISKIPGADKVKIVNAITDAAVKAKPQALSPGVRTLLGPANVARIMAASQAVPKNRKEALDSLSAVAP